MSPARRHGLAVLCAAGCGQPEPLEPSRPPTAEIVLEPTEGARLCAGTEAWAAAEVTRVIAQTGLEPRFDLPVELGRAAVERRCVDGSEPEVIIGCAQGQEGSTALFTTPDALAHELVHGLRRQQELRTRSLFEEGFAEALGGSDPHPRFIELDPSEVPDPWQPEALLRIDRLDRGETYRVASHFMTFLQAEHGEEAVAAFMRGGIDDTSEAAQQRFATHFGRTLGDAADAWQGAGRQGLGLGTLCPDGIEPAPMGEVVLSAAIDCDDPGTMGLVGAGESAWVRRCLELPEGRMNVELDHGLARFESVPGSCAEGSSELDAAPKELAAGEMLELEFAECIWAVTFTTTSEEPQSPTLHLRHE